MLMNCGEDCVIVKDTRRLNNVVKTYNTILKNPHKIKRVDHSKIGFIYKKPYFIYEGHQTKRELKTKYKELTKPDHKPDYKDFSLK